MHLFIPPPTIWQEYTMTEHFRMSGMYWGLTAMDILGQLDKMSRSEVIQFIRQCQDAESGGFSASLGHDPHMLFTLSAVQVPCWGIVCLPYLT